MSTEVESQTEEYPESWDDVDKGAKQSAAGGDYLDKKAFAGGEKVGLRIIVGPYAIGEIGAPQGKPFEVPDAKEEGKTVKRYSLRVPFGSTVPGQRVKAKYVFEVIVLDGSEAGKHKIWEVGQTIADQLKDIRSEWGDIKKVDLRVWKTGEKLETEWHVVAKPPMAVGEDQLVPQFKLKEKVTFATAAQLAALPKEAGPKDSLSKPMSKAQAAMIQDLCSAKDLTLKFVCERIKSKFGRECTDLDEAKLTTAEASSLIDILKGL